MNDRDTESGSVLLIVTLFVFVFLIIVMGIFMMGSVVVQKKRAQGIARLVSAAIMEEIRSEVVLRAERHITKHKAVTGNQSALNWLTPADRTFVMTDPAIRARVQSVAKEIFAKNNKNHDLELEVIFPYTSADPACVLSTPLSVQASARPYRSILFKNLFLGIAGNVAEQSSINTLSLCPDYSY